VTKENRGAQRGIVVILIIGFGQLFEGLGINPVLDVRAIDTQQDDLPAALDRQLCSGAKRYILERMSRL
jgi:hypothetical protein